MIDLPKVLIVDDRPDDERVSVQQFARGIDVAVLHPEDVAEHDLQAAHLILVDYLLEDWAERDNQSSLSLKPLNGLALTATLREHLREDRSRRSVPAFALRSAHLDRLSDPFPTGQREHTIARTHDLEWVFPKVPAASDVWQQIESLARAVRELPTSWPQDDSESTSQTVSKLLAIPDDSWRLNAFRDIEDCHAPIHQLSEMSHGLALLRWMLHRILPYPCFLWDVHYLAARFRVTSESLRHALSEDDDFARLLSSFQYNGILHDFLGKRWWRAGLETYIWDSTDGNPFDIQAFIVQRASDFGVRIEPLEFIQPVVCVDSLFSPLPDLSPIEDALRIQPDDWPAYADQAWTSLGLAGQEPTLRSLVVSNDRQRLTE